MPTTAAPNEWKMVNMDDQERARIKARQRSIPGGKEVYLEYRAAEFLSLDRDELCDGMRRWLERIGEGDQVEFEMLRALLAGYGVMKKLRPTIPDRVAEGENSWRSLG